MESKERWPALLHDFTNRNAGRRGWLENDDPEFGAQIQEVDYPLRGVAYDPRDDRVEIMFGDQGSTDQHLTHSITAAVAIEVRTAEAGRGETLRIVHDDAQTLIHLEPPRQDPARPLSSR
jgi:hypothetical protein